MIPGEIKDHQGELSYTQFYIYIVSMGLWFNSFRVPRKHDQIPVIYSTPQRAYFLNQLKLYGFDTNNGQIPTPIISYYMTGYEHKKERDLPGVVKWLNKNDNMMYPRMIPYDLTFNVSVWTRKQMDMYEIMFQFQSSFEQGMHWIDYIDPITKMTQTTPFFLEGITDASNIEPGADGEVEWRTDVSIRAECYLPRPGRSIHNIKKLYIDLGTENSNDNCIIEYFSGNVYNIKKNQGILCGNISSGSIYFSGVVNQGLYDEEFIIENYTF
jgi:hypothetical protein